jgi:hypothetical protein
MVFLHDGYKASVLASTRLCSTDTTPPCWLEPVLLYGYNASVLAVVR